MTAINVLFLCTHNSARSVLGEVTTNALGEGRLRAFSAGSHPSGKVNPLAIETLAGLKFDVSDVRSKSWDEFGGADAPRFDIVITVCDDAADEACPLWQGAPVKVHWGLPDPSRAPGSDDDRRLAFKAVQSALAERIQYLKTVVEMYPEPANWQQVLTKIHEKLPVPDFSSLKKAVT